MHIYLGVNAVKSKGTKIFARPSSMPSGFRLIGIVSKGLYSIAPDLTDISEFNYYYEAYNSGSYIKFDLYLLEEGLVPVCPDEGKVSNYG